MFESTVAMAEWVQDQQISVTKRSLNIIKEYRNYLWKFDDKLNKILNVPEDDFNHTMDAIRYGLDSYRPKKTKKKKPRKNNSLTGF